LVLPFKVQSVAFYCFSVFFFPYFLLGAYIVLILS